MISTGVPSGIYGISSSGTTMEITPFVSVSSSHLVTDLNFPFHGHIHLYYLEDPGRKVISLFKLFKFLYQRCFQAVLICLEVSSSYGFKLLVFFILTAEDSVCAVRCPEYSLELLRLVSLPLSYIRSPLYRLPSISSETFSLREFPSFFCSCFL